MRVTRLPRPPTSGNLSIRASKPSRLSSARRTLASGCLFVPSSEADAPFAASEAIPPRAYGAVAWGLHKVAARERRMMGRFQTVAAANTGKYLATVVATLSPKHHADDPERVAASWAA